jgi:hypothetical protein
MKSELLRQSFLKGGFQAHGAKVWFKNVKAREL